MRSKLHPGFSTVFPYVLRAASCAILGCEYTSETSVPTSSNAFNAPSITSSTLMSSASFIRLFRSLSGVSLMMQSSITLPVVRLLMILRRTSIIGGPPFVVVTSRRDLGNVLANTPEPMCLHDRSARSMRPPECTGPGCCARLDMSSALSSVLAVSSCSASFLFWPCCTTVPLSMRSPSSASSSGSLFCPLGDGAVVVAAAGLLVALSPSSPESSLLRLRLALIPSSSDFEFCALMSELLSAAVAPDPLAPVALFELAAASGSIAMARFVIPSILLSAARSNRSLDFASCRRSSSNRRRHSKV